MCCPLSALATLCALGLAVGNPRLPGESFAAAAPKTLEPEAALEDAACVVAPVAAAFTPEKLVLVPEVPVPVALVPDDASVVSVWLMLTNCSRLLTETNWLTYSLGSALEVGSWFFNSVTSRVRKSFDEMVAAELLEVLELLVPVDGVVKGLTLLPERAELAAGC